METYEFIRWVVEAVEQILEKNIDVLFDVKNIEKHGIDFRIMLPGPSMMEILTKEETEEWRYQMTDLYIMRQVVFGQNGDEMADIEQCNREW